MRHAVLIAIALLGACSSAGAKEEEKYEMVERQSAQMPEDVRDRELCAQGKAVAAAYLDERNEAKFKDWKLRADIHCLAASL